MWVRFTQPYSWKPTVNTTNDYPAGAEANLPTAAAEAAIASGKAEPIEGKGMPRKSSAVAKGAPKAIDDAPAGDGADAGDSK